MEDIGKTSSQKMIINVSRKRNRQEEEDLFVGKTWKEALGEMPPFGTTQKERKKWFKFQKLKWQFQRKQKKIMNKTGKVNRNAKKAQVGPADGTLGAIRKRAKTVLDQFWSIIQINPLGKGEFKIWAYIGTELHSMHVTVPRIFYVNRKTPKTKEIGPVWKRVQKILPRSTPANYLYQYSIGIFYHLPINKVIINKHLRTCVCETQIAKIFCLEIIFESQLKLTCESKNGVETNLVIRENEIVLEIFI